MKPNDPVSCLMAKKMYVKIFINIHYFVINIKKMKRMVRQNINGRRGIFIAELSSTGKVCFMPGAGCKIKAGI
jgi:hypothetical protein